MTVSQYRNQIQNRNFLTPGGFEFTIEKNPKINFFCQTANIPGISLGQATVDTPLKSIPFPGDELNYQDLGISFLVDENLNNYKEIHDWLVGLGAPQNHNQFATLRDTGTDRFPGHTTHSPNNNTVPAGAKYSDATLTIMNSKHIANVKIRFHNIFTTSLGPLTYDLPTRAGNTLHTSITFRYN